MTILSERISARASARGSRMLAALSTTAFVLDLVLVAVAVILAVFGRRHFGIFDTPADVSSSVIGVAPPLGVAWVLLINAFGGYRTDVFGAGVDEFKRVFTASLYTAGILGVTCYLLKFQLSRGFFVLAFVLGVPLLMVGRLLLRRALHAARSRGVLLQRVLIVGSPTHVDEIAHVLRREKWLGYSVVGAVTPSVYAITETDAGVPVVGHADDLSTFPSTVEGADVLFFAGGGHFGADDLRQIQWELERRDISIVVAPNLTDVSSDRVRIRPVGGLPLMHLEAPRWAHAGRWAKRAFDLVGSGLLIVACSPILVYAALRVKLNDGGSVFFRQTRVGRFGNEFGCFKFRTMVMNAEALIGQLQEEQGMGPLLFKMREDPRITKPGRWLRRYSIDELPQLFNVFIGDMSLVGPRPQVPQEVAEYDDALRRRLNVRPGMTGLWQVSGRSELSVEESTRLDLYYIDNWSMLQDIVILGRTFGAVLSSKGAY